MTTAGGLVEQRIRCPHGDDTCPCPDRYGDEFDPCHYEGDDPMPCSTTGEIGCVTCTRERAELEAKYYIAAAGIDPDDLG